MGKRAKKDKRTTEKVRPIPGRLTPFFSKATKALVHVVFQLAQSPMELISRHYQAMFCGPQIGVTFGFLRNSRVPIKLDRDIVAMVGLCFSATDPDDLEGETYLAVITNTNFLHRSSDIENILNKESSLKLTDVVLLLDKTAGYDVDDVLSSTCDGQQEEMWYHNRRM